MKSTAENMNPCYHESVCFESSVTNLVDLAVYWRTCLLHRYPVGYKTDVLMCRWGGTPIENAVKANQRIIANLLKRSGACLSSSFSQKCTFTAARQGDVHLLALLADSGSPLTATNYDGVRASTLLCTSYFQ
jgi:hypothetical protein